MVLRGNPDMTLEAFVDASFAVHHDMKSHTGVVITLGSGAISVMSKRQSLNTKSSTESELVGVSDALPMIVWVREFLIDQGYKSQPAKLYQDNLSTMSLIGRGHSNSNRTRHIAIRYFFVKDRVEKGELSVHHMPTGDMLADIFTKPLQGDLFRRLRYKLLGVE
jgi:hypothetical protein